MSDERAKHDSVSSPALATGFPPNTRLHSLPVGIFLANPVGEEVQIVEEAIHKICDTLGFELLIDNPPQIGSWIHDWLYRSKKALTSHQVTERLAELEYALHLQILGKPQTDIDEAQIRAIAELLKATENDEMVVHVGLVFAVRWKNSRTGKRQVVVKSLTPQEFVQLQQHPTLLRDPEAMIQILEKLDYGGGAAGPLELPTPTKPLQPAT